MPIDSIDDRGTEKNGTVSNEYCKYCYQQGAFTTPGITMDQMKTFMQSKMQEMKIPADILQRSLELLPKLKRWQKSNL
jgi:hypothetical protein